MIYVIIGIIIVVVCVIIYFSTDHSVIIKKDLIKPVLLSLFSFAGCMLSLYPFIRYSIETTALKKDTVYLQNEIKAENGRRGDISEALVWEITEHNDKVGQYFNGYNLWFGTPMFQHDTSKYIVSVDGYTIWKKQEETETPTAEETKSDEIAIEEETTVEEDTTVILNGKEYRLISIPRY